ncbi:unnamed protein product [Darwinula stevensoni]|uniref:Uncharacterized protein n=1 Tax=Darwinula stevensoni TaxID=69355 RepID=A0A7R8X2A2_9CRUS|nr:unnamed protein product [Darwinula stevensoni]CAG0881200.1 unnamed protein product [Darwinula stevensoni]
MGESLKLKMEFHEDKSTHSEDPISEKPESTYQALPPSLDVTRLLADERLRAEKYKLLYQNLKSTQLRMEGDLEVIREEFRQLQHEKETAEQEHRRAMEIVKEQVAAKISQLKEFEMKGNLPGEDWRAPGHKPCAELLERISGLELRNLQLEQRLKMVLDEQEMLVTHLKQKDLEAEKHLQERTLRFKVQASP